MATGVLSYNFVGVESGISYFFGRFRYTYTFRIIDEAFLLLKELWPYIIAGIIATTLIKIYFSKEQVSGLFLKKGGVSIIIAALIGVVTPLGSYIIIPLSAAMFLIGVPMHVLMALIISSPLINPNLFILTAGAFGYEMALIRLATAFILGIMAGFVTFWVQKTRTFENVQIVKSKYDVTIFLNRNSGKGYIRNFMDELLKMSKYVGKYFFLAILLSAIIKILTPPGLLLRFFGDNDMLSVLISTGAGIPFYVCGGAAIPVVQQLAEMGLSKGAVLAFFISGPVIKISNLILINTAFNYRISAVYFLVGVMGAILSGYIYNLF